MKRSTPIRRGKPPARSRKPIARSPIKHRAKKPSTFAYQFGSKARVTFVKSLACCANTHECSGPIENAHTTRRAGMGLKGPASDIAPLCRFHHRLSHTMSRRAFEYSHLVSLEQAAQATEAAWQAHQGEPTA